MNTTSNTHQTDETSEQFTLMKSPMPTYSSEDFHARLSALLVSEQDLEQKIHEVLSFLKSVDSSLVKESHIYSLKMLKDSSITTEGEPLELSSQVWMNWGMTYSGNVLTAKILESRKVGSESSLSAILETDPDPKYFLSEDAIQRMVFKTERNKLLNRGFKPQIIKDSQSEPYFTDFTRETLTTSTLKTEYVEKLMSLGWDTPEEDKQLGLF
jgi:hypothetical protein